MVLLLGGESGVPGINTHLSDLVAALYITCTKCRHRGSKPLTALGRGQSVSHPANRTPVTCIYFYSLKPKTLETTLHYQTGHVPLIQNDKFRSDRNIGINEKKFLPRLRRGSIDADGKRTSGFGDDQFIGFRCGGVKLRYVRAGSGWNLRSHYKELTEQNTTWQREWQRRKHRQ